MRINNNNSSSNDDDDANNNNNSSSRNRNTGCNKWQITNLGTASRKEHKYSYFCRSSKRCEKN